MTKDTITRRDFLIGASAATAGMWLMGQELRAQTPANSEPTGPATKVAVIGLGMQGREILGALAKLNSASVVAVCDTYEPFFRRALELAPNAETETDYRKVLEMSDVEGVIIATPSHLHKDIVVDALAAGKHVYCEAPLASNMDEAREIAKAGLESSQIFQSGLQNRADHQRQHILSFMRTGVPGSLAYARAQHNRKTSWRRMAPTAEREAELNWRLDKDKSAGLLGEIAIHQIDVVDWFVNSEPIAVSATGGVMHWTDGRDMADTVKCMFEYPNDFSLSYNATLANSYEGSYETIYGSEAAILLRGQKAWMFKEADSAMLGWEVYAHKDQMGDDVGIALVADATKLLEAGKKPGEEGTDESTDALYYSMEDFVTSIKEGKEPVAGPEAGYRAAVVAIKANEALVTGERIVYQQEWFEIV